MIKILVISHHHFNFYTEHELTTMVPLFSPLLRWCEPWTPWMNCQTLPMEWNRDKAKSLIRHNILHKLECSKGWRLVVKNTVQNFSIKVKVARGVFPECLTRSETWGWLQGLTWQNLETSCVSINFSWSWNEILTLEWDFVTRSYCNFHVQSHAFLSCNFFLPSNTIMIARRCVFFCILQVFRFIDTEFYVFIISKLI